MSRWLALVLLVATSHSVRAQDGDGYACHPATGKLRATFKPDTELKDVVTWFMGFSCKNVVIGAGVDVTAKVTLITPAEMTPKQAQKLFVDAVDAAGFTVNDKDDNVIIKRPAGAPPCPSVASSAAADDSDPLTAILEAGIKKVDDTHYVVSPKVIDAMLANPMGISKGARIVPAMKDGKAEGMKLYAVRPGSLYARIGLQNGDLVRTFNGMELTSADKALEAYTKLRDAKSIELDLVRRGKPVQLIITIK